MKHNEFVPEKVRARFLQPMLLNRIDKLPEGNQWLYELKHDGCRGIAYKTGGKLYPRSRNDNDFNLRYPTIAKALSTLPNETVVDGEIVAFDESGKPSFNTLQNHGSSGVPLVYFIFDVMPLHANAFHLVQSTPHPLGRSLRRGRPPAVPNLLQRSR